MRNSFERLGHHAVVSRYHQNDDVSRLSTAGAHGRKGFMPRGIQERDDAARRFHMIRTDVLRDAARFTRGNLGAADVVQKRRLTVVNVTHDRDDRGTGHGGVLLGTLFDFTQERFRIVGLGGNRLVAHFFNENHGRILIKHLIDGDHLAHLHQNLDDFGGLHAHLVREIGNGNRLRHTHLTHHGFRGHLLHALLVMVLLAAAASPVVISRVIAAAGLDRAALLTFVIPAAVVVAFALAALAALFGLVVAVTGSRLCGLGFGLFLRFSRLGGSGRFFRILAVVLIAAVGLCL